MDEKSRKYFNKPESELSDYERMMLDIMAANEPAPAEEAPVEEILVEEAPIEEAPVEDAPVEDAPVEEVPVEEVPVEEAPVEEAPVEEAPVEEAPIEEPAPDDSDVKIAGEEPAPKAEPIPLLVEEKNPELEPVVINRPSIQFQNSIEREKKITQKVRRHNRRSGIVVLGLCVALILVAFLYNGFVNKSWGILEKAEPTPEPTPEQIVEATPTPEPTPEPTPTPPPEHRYVIERADLSWIGAQDLCLSSGGYLAVISSQEEFDRIVGQAEQQGIERLWIGCHRVNNDLVWENGEKVDFYVWGDGEPSYIDTGDGAAEDYIMLWKIDGKWCYNDSRNDLAGEFFGWRGTIGYVCEFEG